MRLSREQIKELEEHSVSIIDWLKDNCSKHTKVIIGTDSVEVIESVARAKVENLEESIYEKTLGN